MRRVVVRDDLREALIRPDHHFNTYIELLASDLDQLLQRSSLIDVEECPGCAHEEREPDFEKMGMKYVRCLNCGTSYVTPRPSKADLDAFYGNSEAVQYWNNSVVEPTADARRQYIVGPRTSWVLEAASTYEQDHGTFIDYYSKYPAYLHQISKRGNFELVYSRHPLVSFPAEVEGVVTLSSELDDSSVAVVSAFEVLERLFDPRAFLGRMHEILEDGGLIFLTTLSISGFDLSLLRGNARNILPPTHITMFSYAGIQRIMSETGFEIEELSTPGRLDVALVLDALEREESLSLPPIIQTILEERSEIIQEEFQAFLQQANLSSHVWIVARKKGS